MDIGLCKHNDTSGARCGHLCNLSSRLTGKQLVMDGEVVMVVGVDAASQCTGQRAQHTKHLLLGSVLLTTDAVRR